MVVCGCRDEGETYGENEEHPKRALEAGGWEHCGILKDFLREFLIERLMMRQSWRRETKKVIKVEVTDAYLYFSYLPSAMATPYRRKHHNCFVYQNHEVTNLTKS